MCQFYTVRGGGGETGNSKVGSTTKHTVPRATTTQSAPREYSRRDPLPTSCSHNDDHYAVLIMMMTNSASTIQAERCCAVSLRREFCSWLVPLFSSLS